MTDFTKGVSRRGVLKGGAALGAGLALPTFFTNKAHAYLNEPKGSTVTFGFNVPQTGAYADEGADELRAYKLAVKHINDGGGGMLDTFSSKALTGGVNGKTVEYRHGRHADEIRRRARQRQADDRERRRDHDHRRFVVGRRGRRAGALPGNRRDLHGWSDALERHHR